MTALELLHLERAVEGEGVGNHVRIAKSIWDGGGCRTLAGFLDKVARWIFTSSFTVRERDGPEPKVIAIET